MASEMIDVEMSSSSESSDSSSESENESESSSHSNNTNNSVTYNNNNAGNRKKQSNSGFLGEMERVKIKAFIKKAVCEYCGASGAKSSFYSKNKRFCSFSCSVHGAAAEATSPQPIPSSGGKTSAQLKTIKRTSTQTGKAKKQKQNVAAATTELGPSFDWKIPYLKIPDFEAAPVSCFRHASLSDMWDNVIVGMKLEVENKDCENFGNLFPNFYWIATVTKIAGYMVCLRYEGFGMDDTKDFWINLCVESVHPVGWCASQGKPLIPPKTIEHKHSDWKGFLVKRLTGARTLPANFAQKVQDSLKSRFRVGMKLEVVDKNRISCVRVATVQEIVGGRLHIAYEQAEDLDEGFWCHERSPLIHPVGWAQIVGHDLRASLDYAKKSLQKTLLKKFDLNDCTWEMFLPVKNVSSDLKFKEGMKLEAIDPLNLSTICVATVTRVLRNNYLMIGIDGMMAANGSDWFCYHASSPHIFPVGFCDLNKIHLTPPRGHEGEFNWFNYLNETNSAAAPVALFKKELPNHGFKEGMHVEAVDLMEPRLICVGKVTRVVGRLLRVHFEGWDISYDQWCDCGSPDLFPVGWCQVVGYRLEPPREEENSKKVKKYKPPVYKGHRRRGKPKKTTGGGKKEPKMQIKLEPDVSDTMNQNYPNLTYSSTQTNSKKSATSVNEVSSSRPVPTPSKVSNVATKKSVSGVALSSTHSEVDPERWTILDVAQFLRINECGAYCQVFSQQRIDGQKFLNMSKEDVMSLTGMKVGPSLKIFDLITQLKNKKIRF